MKRRLISIIILVIALLFSAWSNVITAAFCPRYMSNRNCCIEHEIRQPMQVDHKSSCQHEMADMEMVDMQMESEAPSEAAANSLVVNPPIHIATEASSDQVVVDLPIESCAHCWMHSQPTSGTTTVAAIDPSKRLVETNAPPADFAMALPPALVLPITPREHEPPGNPFPRHALINVFRI
jgi:hypothetical protein